MGDPPEIRWIECGIVAGLCASVLYPVLLFAPLPLAATAAAAALLGPAIGVGSLGLRQLIRLQGESVSAFLGSIINLVAGALFTAMALIQLAVRHASPNSALPRNLTGVWLGLDVAWDVYIGLGTLFFAWSMLGHPRFRWPFALPGFVVGFLVVALNLYTFPIPPGEAGLFDIGPFVGLWYLAATVQSWRSLGWARAQLGTLA
ncbi:MAG: hypothetical protein WCE51_13855 [Chthoniobacterales bacterium]